MLSSTSYFFYAFNRFLPRGVGDRKVDHARTVKGVQSPSQQINPRDWWASILQSFLCKKINYYVQLGGKG
jgi:hypothetical protein